MPLLGMLAAGAAIGARDASNASIEERNRMQSQINVESIREEFANRRYQRDRKDLLADREAAIKEGDRIYTRDRSDKLADDESSRGFDLKKLDIVQAHDMTKHKDNHSIDRARVGHEAQRIEHDKVRLEYEKEDMQYKRDMIRARNAKVPEGVQIVEMDSPLGKSANDHLRSGLAKNYPEAFKKAARKSAMDYYLNHPVFGVQDPIKLWPKIEAMAEKEYGEAIREFEAMGGSTESKGGNGPQDKSEARNPLLKTPMDPVTKLTYDPKTGAVN